MTVNGKFLTAQNAFDIEFMMPLVTDSEVDLGDYDKTTVAFSSACLEIGIYDTIKEISKLKYH